jgi:hypothetical protein
MLEVSYTCILTPAEDRPRWDLMPRLQYGIENLSKVKDWSRYEGQITPIVHLAAWENTHDDLSTLLFFSHDLTPLLSATACAVRCQTKQTTLAFPSPSDVNQNQLTSVVGCLAISLLFFSLYRYSVENIWYDGENSPVCVITSTSSMMINLAKRKSESLLAIAHEAFSFYI